jgi:hypothetical protein
MKAMLGAAAALVVLERQRATGLDRRRAWRLRHGEHEHVTWTSDASLMATQAASYSGGAAPLCRR